MIFQNGEWPSGDWAKDNLWIKGIATAGVVPKANNPAWYCRVCDIRHKIRDANFNSALKHANTRKHKQNLLLAQLSW